MKRFLLLFMLATTIHICQAQNTEKNLKEILLNKQWAGCNTNGEIDTGDYKIRCKFTADTLIVSFLGKDWDFQKFRKLFLRLFENKCFLGRSF